MSVSWQNSGANQNHCIPLYNDATGNKRQESMISDRVEAPGTFLFVVPWSLHHPGGVNQVVINLYRECARSELFNPLVLVLDWSQPSTVEQVEAGCKTIHLRIRPPAIGLRGTIYYLLGLPATIRDLRNLIEQYAVRAVSVQYPTLEALNFVVLRKLGLFKGKLLLSFHGLDIRNAARKKGIEGLLWRRLLRRADALIACSDSLGKDVSAYDRIAARSLVTVRNGVDKDVIFREKGASSHPAQQIPSRQYVLSIATYEHKKGQDVLVKAFACIAADFPDLDLVIIGGDGPTRQQIGALISALGLGNRVHCLFNVPHPEVLAYLERASVFVLPSRAEGLPIAILEAATFAIPVIASRVDGIPEIINSEHVGILIEPEDDRGLEAALRRLLTDRAFRSAIGKNLQARVASEFTWRKAWASYTSLLGMDAVQDRQSAR